MVMDTRTEKSIPVWFWVVAGIALLWNLLGTAIFFQELLNQEALIKDWTEPQKEWARGTPRWIYFVFGISVFTGLVGSFALLMRKAWSIPLFAMSLVAVLVQMIYTMVIAGGLKIMGVGSAVMPFLVIILAGLWFIVSIQFRKQQWLD